MARSCSCCSHCNGYCGRDKQGKPQPRSLNDDLLLAPCILPCDVWPLVLVVVIDQGGNAIHPRSSREHRAINVTSELGGSFQHVSRSSWCKNERVLFWFGQSYGHGVAPARLRKPA